MKTVERLEAVKLRRELGMSVREIARAVEVSRSTASLWLRDVPLTPEQRAALAARNPVYNGQTRGAAVNAARARTRRVSFQRDGRERARQADTLYVAGCMLYWGEGEKGHGAVRLTNSDPALLALFVRFLRECFGVPNTAMRVRCHLFADHLSRQHAIEEFWLRFLDLPRSCLNRSAVNAYSRASQRKRRGRLPYGTCRVAVCDRRILQTIYGSIQELGGFERPEWLG